MDAFRKLIDIGLGLLAVSKETAQQIVNELVKRGEMTREESERFVADLTHRGEKLRGDISEQVQTAVRAQLEKLNLATKDDVARLERRLAALEAAASGRAAETDED
ncbi:MAG: polyhydroxyalkanoate synthesis regulator [Planctomycetota bacterium]